jgi:hypothetical protein
MQMNEAQTKALCIALMNADTEDEVVGILNDAGLWNDPALWRLFGDRESNYNTIGNQQSSPDAALVEKLVNSVDARLMNECLVRGIDPEGPNAPQTIREAVAMFFDDSYNPGSPHAGQIRNWPNLKRTEIARGITLVATGAGARSGSPCFTISDCGEGQTPERMPDTLLSLDRTNKLRIPFVQGKFNMGGTGVFKFCGGKHHLQLVVSRRNPAIVMGKMAHPSDTRWGFSIVRRESEGGGAGGRRSSVYTYLAPVGASANPGRGGVLRFTAESMPIFPEGRAPYARESKWGTLIKLYEYSTAGFSASNIVLTRPSLLNRMDLLLPDVALPIRLYECRPTYKGHKGSFENNLTGLTTRLEDGRGENLEEGFPSSCPLSAMGEQMVATIYAFKKDRADTYRKNEGIIFTLNGQTHGHITPDFFVRKAVGLSYLADSILVVVDCGKFSIQAREDLFMNSRDRLSRGEMRNELERALEEMLKQHQGLRDLKERRRREQTEAKLADSKPLEDILESLLKKSPTLANLFLKGLRASNPFKTVKVREEEVDPFVGKRFPTFFKFKDKEYGQEIVRETPINMRSRIVFETDAENEYFSRTTEKGEFALFLLNGDHRVPVAGYVGPNLQNGIATLSVQLPLNCQVGDVLKFVALVIDSSRLEPFENRFTVKVRSAVEPSGEPGPRRKPPAGEPGDDREAAAGIALPNIIEVYEKDWGKYNPNFDKYTALRIKNAGADEAGQNGEAKPVYDFYVNMDNLYLNTEIKPAHRDPKLVRARFTYGMVLLGLALVQQDEVEKAKAKEKKSEDKEEPRDDEQDVNIEQRVAEFTQAVAPVLLPMIESLGDLDEDQIPAIVGSGEGT